MRTFDFGADLRKCLDRFHRLGGVVDYYAFQFGKAEVSETQHKEAAVGFMERVASAKRWSFSLHPEAAVGHLITVEEFMGPYYDWKRGRLIVRGRGQHGNRYFLAGETETKENAVRLPANNSEYVIRGYAQAFSEPSYGLQAPPEEVNRLFQEINRPLFSGFEPELEIYQWSTDWSGYFEAGQEWWGCFLWTAFNPLTRCIVAVGASTTD